MWECTGWKKETMNLIKQNWQIKFTQLKLHRLALSNIYNMVDRSASVLADPRPRLRVLLVE